MIVFQLLKVRRKRSFLWELLGPLSGCKASLRCFPAIPVLTHDMKPPIPIATSVSLATNITALVTFFIGSSYMFGEKLQSIVQLITVPSACSLSRIDAQYRSWFQSSRHMLKK